MDPSPLFESAPSKNTPQNHQFWKVAHELKQWLTPWSTYRQTDRLSVAYFIIQLIRKGCLWNARWCFIHRFLHCWVWIWIFFQEDIRHVNFDQNLGICPFYNFRHSKIKKVCISEIYTKMSRLTSSREYC